MPTLPTPGGDAGNHSVEEFKAALRQEIGADNPVAGLPAGLQDPGDATALQGPSWPPLEGLDDMEARYTLRPPDLVEGTLSAGGRMVLGGASKTNKTWALADLAVALATGRTWLGKTCKPCNVVFVNFEVIPYFMKERFKLVRDAKGIHPEDAGLKERLRVWNLRGISYNLETLTGVLAQVLNGRPVDVLIVDPIYKAMASMDENAAGDVGEMMLALERFADSQAAAVVFSHHFSKGGQAAKDPADRFSGSGVFARSPDSALTITRHEEEGTFVISSILRDFSTPEDYCVKMEFPILTPTDADPTKLHTPGSKPTSYTPAQALLFLPSSGASFGDWFSAAKEAAGISKGRFTDLVKALVESGDVVKEDKLYRPVVPAIANNPLDV